jgi:hypothetical protein
MSVMAEQAKDVEVSYIEKLKNRAAISFDLEKALKKMSENRFQMRRGSGGDNIVD